ncbi:hypothetical protein UA08_01014 [Talaromyces atroroseus]|uniref:Zn(2)-C6 fungal-type domain-containing protein n=1 Tax=Talaromyces atroroseus TaxID=1441469 RepID=A0A225AYT6_TALAT|nr:hypothetical protein UA08_01014 [Talaromyces atroroseus]OKL63614.1 hypothetical protein UA08_01014 [Talaromyces atroroseus]
MPGPGGGPPRKSHTKSRNGCRTCKRRHIRCDETFPQCRNCTKHNCRCDYMDVQTTRDDSVQTPKTPLDLLMTPEIDAEIENWRTTGIPPFQELSQCPRNDWHRFSKSTLRLIHHIAGLSIDLHRRGLGHTTVWSACMPRLLALAVMSDFVMNGILALSALHMTYVTGSKDILNLSHHYRKTASKGLQNALGTFSQANCDAILAASLVLSWQATDWESISTLQKGIIYVLDSMHPSWKESSEIAQILDSQRILRTRNSTYNLDSSPGGTPHFRNEILRNIDSTIVDLHRSQERLSHISEFHDTITELIDYVKLVRNELPMQSQKAAFTRLQTLRAWIFWLPTKLLRGGEGDLVALSVLAHVYSTALVLEPFFPSIEGSYIGCMTLSLIQNIDSILLSRKSSFPLSHITQLAAGLMDAPRHNFNDYKSHTQYAHQMQHMSHVVPTPPSPYHQFHDFSSSFVTSGASYTPAMLSSFPLATTAAAATTTSPFQASPTYRSSGNFSNVYMSPSIHASEYYDDSLSDYSRPGAAIDHSAGFSSFGSEAIHGMPTTEAGGTFHSDLAQDIPITGPSSTSELWT